MSERAFRDLFSPSFKENILIMRIIEPHAVLRSSPSFLKDIFAGIEF